MDNQELLQYLKDAIEQETSIIVQQEMIKQALATQHERKPEFFSKKSTQKAPQLQQASYRNSLFNWSIGLGIALFVIGIIILLFSNWCIGMYSGVWGLEEDLEAAYQYRNTSRTILLAGIICFIPAVLSAISTYRQNQNNHIEYNQAYQRYKSHVNEIESENMKLKQDHHAKISEWDASFRQLKEHMSKPLSESQALLKNFYSSDVIYPKYRNLPALTSMYEYFVTGRCTELTGPHGAYNMYEDEVRKDTVISQLNTVIENLEQIKQNQYMLYQQVKSINENTQVIASELRQIKGYTVQIAQLSALNAYYAALNERNTRITMYYHL